MVYSLFPKLLLVQLERTPAGVTGRKEEAKIKKYKYITQINEKLQKS